MSTLDLFRIRDHVPDFDDVVRDILARSELARARLPMKADVHYGSGASETVDLFFPENMTSAAPVHMFIHGGYWRMFSKDDYSCIAETITNAGAIAVIVDYALMPTVRMAHIVDQVRRARDWIVAHISDFGGDPQQLTVSGHSAGAHLATFLFNDATAQSTINAAVLLGGLYDLKPLQSSFLKSEIAITDEEVSRFTPLDIHHSGRTRVRLLVGSLETEPFHLQASEFRHLLTSQGLSVDLHELPERHHMDSARDLGIAHSDAGKYLTEFCFSRTVG